MKKLIILFITAIIAVALPAQPPQKMSYQAVVRNAAGELVNNQSIGIKISILQGSPDGILIFQEIYNPNPQTNANGLVSMEIGEGIPLTGTFSGIDWSNGPYYLMTETDPAGGTNYTISGTSQLLSVPYALYANRAENYTESDPVFDLSAAAGITEGNISDWNTAWGWGNHASAGYVPDSRNLTINGTTLDLTANRSWNVGTVSSVGLTLPDIFQVSGSPVSEKGTLTATFSKQSNNLVFASPVKGLSGPPAFRPLVSIDIPELNWSKITSGKPTTLAGYGITDGVNTTGNQTISGNKTFTGTITVPTPDNLTDAVPKAYVDALLTQIQKLENEPGIVKDCTGNLYTTLKIGTQVWLGENLKTTSYNDGTAIPNVTNNTDWAELITDAYCDFNNTPAYSDINGRLYNWYAVNTGKLCPTGWHVPTDTEWLTLTNYLGSISIAGGKLKEAGTAHWPTPNTGSTNESGFTALPSGYRYLNGTFLSSGTVGMWWTSTEISSISAWEWYLTKDNSNITRNSAVKQYGNSVRCIKD